MFHYLMQSGPPPILSVPPPLRYITFGTSWSSGGMYGCEMTVIHWIDCPVSCTFSHLMKTGCYAQLWRHVWVWNDCHPLVVDKSVEHYKGLTIGYPVGALWGFFLSKLFFFHVQNQTMFSSCGHIFNMSGENKLFSVCFPVWQSIWKLSANG